jgi:DNA-binding CsgD family transcriptional regulator
MRLRGNRQARVVVVTARGPDEGDLALVHCALADDREARVAGYLTRVLERTPENSGGMRKLPAQLTPRENEVLSLLARDVSLEEIAEKLGVSYVTVRNHTQHIREKLEVHSTLEAVVQYLMTDR